MKLRTLERKPYSDQDKKLQDVLDGFDRLIHELKKKDIPQEIVTQINLHTDEINASSALNKPLLKHVKTIQSAILKLVEKELKLVTKNHYRNTWLAAGMSAFGLPIGVAIGLSVGNIGLLALGLPIGMGIGIAVGTRMDKKAYQTGKQLDVEIKN